MEISLSFRFMSIYTDMVLVQIRFSIICAIESYRQSLVQNMIYQIEPIRAAHPLVD